MRPKTSALKGALSSFALLTLRRPIMPDNKSKKDVIANSTSRRNFLQAVGIGTSFIGLNAFVSPVAALAQCQAPPSATAAKAWGKDCRRILPRRPASTLSRNEVTKLRDSYQAMRALDTSDPNDPRGFTRQANR